MAADSDYREIKHTKRHIRLLDIAKKGPAGPWGLPRIMVETLTKMFTVMLS